MIPSLINWSVELLKVQNASGQSAFYPLLQSLLRQVCHFDEMLVVEFLDKSRTKLLFQMSVNHDSNLETYLSKMFVLDPFYNASKNGVEGLFLLEQLAKGLNETFDDYYSHYFRHLKFNDELGYLIQLPNSTLHIELAKFSNSQQFKHEQIELLSQLFPIIKQLVQQHHQQLTPASMEFATSYVEDFHRHFGVEILTPREYDVNLLMLQGYSVKAIASHLSVGDETIKMHRKKIYAKLNVGSQPELMALFIDLLVMAEPPIRQDPLVAYLQRRRLA